MNNDIQDERAQRELHVRNGISPLKRFRLLLIEAGRMPRYRQFFAFRFPGGVSLSVQASEGHYSTPRRTLPIGNHGYSAWELGTVPASLPREVASLTQWEGGYNEETDEHVSGPDYDSFTVAGWVPRETVQRMLDRLYIELGMPTWDGSDPS